MSTGMYEGAIQDLIDALGRLPGIGPKSAQRIAFHILQSDSEIAANLVEAVRTVKERVKFCTQCGNVSEETECRICRDPRRDGTKICVVEESKDVIAIERTREFRGKYHVLGGAISPIDGIGPDQLRIRELMQRLSDSSIDTTSTPEARAVRKDEAPSDKNLLSGAALLAAELGATVISEKNKD